MKPADAAWALFVVGVAAVIFFILGSVLLRGLWS
jgi:hypothetical protein